MSFTVPRIMTLDIIIIRIKSISRLPIPRSHASSVYVEHPHPANHSNGVDTVSVHASCRLNFVTSGLCHSTAATRSPTH